LLAENRKQNEIALAIVLSGIAATLLERGKTAHSEPKLPLDMRCDNLIPGMAL
jgi:hypothetical protein